MPAPRRRFPQEAGTVENYFNYFTEIEDCYRHARGTPALLSTLDWALIESWKEAGIPLAAVLTGIERTFEKRRKRPRRGRGVNSLAYCAQEVLRAAEETAAEQRATASGTRAAQSPFTSDQLRGFFQKNVEVLRRNASNGPEILQKDFQAAAAALEEIGNGIGDTSTADFADVERRLTALEEKLSAGLTHAASVELLAQFAAEAEKGLAPYRRRMSVVEIERLERQFKKKRLFEHYGVPRLSLFYM